MASQKSSDCIYVAVVVLLSAFQSCMLDCGQPTTKIR